MPAEWPIMPALISRFYIRKKLGAFLLPPGRDPSLSYFMPVAIYMYTPGRRE